VNNRFIFTAGFFLLGIAAGAAIMVTRETDDQQQPVEDLPASKAASTQSSEHPMTSAFVLSQVSDSERITLLEQQVQQLSDRLVALERFADAAQPDSDTGTASALALTTASTVDTPVSSLSPAVTTDNLVKAGIDPELAADIVRRRNEIDMKLLELRDRAAREAYLGTERYAEELEALREQNIPLRDEIGEEYYDSYLFASGRTNRVRIASVMIGSPAETSGMLDGDMILSYDNRRMFNWNELQEATSLGERGEYVNVTVLRNGELVNLWMPRGPLGVRLGAARVKPWE
jgi:C-terminal processing protease CtpA/Prc